MRIETKNDFRKTAIKKLKSYSKNIKIKNDKYIVSEILERIKKEGKKHILLYIPLDMEVNVNPLIKLLRKNKKYKVYVPYMIGKTFKAVPYRLPLKTKKYNIKEPNYSNLADNIIIDIAIVPIVGFDDSYRRVGFGVGFYDRYFCSLKKKPKVIFTQTVECKAKTIITQEHDIKADFIITNKGTLWTK